MFEIILCTAPTIKSNEEIDHDNNLAVNLRILDKFTIKGNNTLESWKKIEQIIKK